MISIEEGNFPIETVVLHYWGGGDDGRGGGYNKIIRFYQLR